MSERKRVLVEAWSEFYRFLALNLSDWNSILHIHYALGYTATNEHC